LSFDTEEETLRTLYSEYGALIDLYIPTDRESGRPRGFAFVTMGKDDALKAIEGTDGIEVDGRLLRVNEAQPKGYAPPRNDEWSEEEGEW
jgi:RNA recognition motif-containing protein